MASQYYRLLDAIALGTNDKSDREDIFDAGAYKNLEVQARVIKAGAAGSIQLEHSAVKESGSWLALGSAISLTATSNALISHSNFLRYVRWVVVGTVTDAPVAVLDVIAKE